MDRPGDKRQLVALRDEIQRSGRLSSRLRQTSALVGVTFGPLFVLLGMYLVNGVVWASELLTILAVLGLGVGLGVGIPVSLALFLNRRNALRKRLAELPWDEQAAVLLPLRNSRGDTRRLVK